MQSITSPPVIFAFPRDRVFPAVPAVMLNMDLEVTGTDPVLGIAWGLRGAFVMPKFVAVYVQPTPDGQTAVTVQVQQDAPQGPNDDISREIFQGLGAALYSSGTPAPQPPPVMPPHPPH